MKKILTAAVLSLCLAACAQAQSSGSSRAPTPTTGRGIINPRPTASFGLGFGFLSDGRLIVSVVQPGSPAEKAGLAPGDTIQAIDGRSTTEPGVGFRGATPGQRFALRVRRGQADLDLVLVAGEPQPAGQR